MDLHFAVFLSCILSCSVITVFCESNDGQCTSLVKGPFDICTKAGYNNTLPFPEEFTEQMKLELGMFLPHLIEPWTNCSSLGLAAAIECSFMFPKCSRGKRVLPCRRVCGELMKQCMNQVGNQDYREIYMDFVLAECLMLPNETPNSDKCFEPPKFTTNDSVPSPLDRGCQKLIFPACKNMGLYQHTLFSESVQKKFYKLIYNKTYDEGDLELAFPKGVQKDLSNYSKCEANIKKIFCGELFPPCFPKEKNPKMKSLCRSVCDDIARDCPKFFSRHIMGVEYCSTLTEGTSSHGFCDRDGWPDPFYWLKYLKTSEVQVIPTKEPEKQGPKGWVIAVAVLVTLLIVGLGLAGIIWWKWRRAPGMGYTKQRDDVTAVEQ